MKTIRLAALMILATLPAVASNRWLEAAVVNAGYINNGAFDIPVVTIAVGDPENVNSLARLQFWAVNTHAFLRRAHADLHVSASFNIRMQGESFMEIQYTDDKGRKRSELHKIIQALGIEDIPGAN